MKLVGNRSAAKAREIDCLMQRMEYSDALFEHVRRARSTESESKPAPRNGGSRSFPLDILSDIAAQVVLILLAIPILGLPETGTVPFYWLLGGAFVWFAVAFARKLYDTRPGPPRAEASSMYGFVRKTAPVTLYAYGILAGLVVAFDQDAQLFRSALAIGSLGTLILIPAGRRCLASMVKKADPGETAVIYGAGRVGRALSQHLLAHPEEGYNPVAFLDDHPTYWGASIHSIPVVGDTNVVLPEATVAFLALSDPHPEWQEYLLKGPLAAYENVVIVHEAPTIPAGWSHIEQLGHFTGIRYQKTPGGLPRKPATMGMSPMAEKEDGQLLSLVHSHPESIPCPNP